MSTRNSIKSSTRRSTRISTKLEKETRVSPAKEEKELRVSPVKEETRVSPVKEEKELRGVRGSPVNELILTPPTPEITQAILEKKPWLSNEFFDLAIEKLGLETERSTNPKLLVLVGPPAAGKSTVKRQLGFQNAVNLDVDEFKILGVKEFGQKAKGMFGDFRKIIQLLSVKIIARGFDFILDTKY